MPALHPLRHRLAREAHWWKLPKGWEITLFTIPLAGALLLGITTLRPPLYHALIREDSPLEWAQFAAYLGATGFAAWTAYRLAHAEQRVHAVLFALFACCCLFAAGEEISWGQRLFGIGTPRELASINGQGELNVHNVVEAQGKFNLALAVISLSALVAPWIARQPSLLIPPAALGSAFLAAFTYTVVRMLFFRHPGYELAKYSEWPELCFAGALTAYAFLSWRQATRGRRHQSTTHRIARGSARRLAFGEQAE